VRSREQRRCRGVCAMGEQTIPRLLQQQSQLLHCAPLCTPHDIRNNLRKWALQHVLYPRLAMGERRTARSPGQNNAFSHVLKSLPSAPTKTPHLDHAVGTCCQSRDRQYFEGWPASSRLPHCEKHKQTHSADICPSHCYTDTHCGAKQQL
jgi:hypothetical protein